MMCILYTIYMMCILHTIYIHIYIYIYLALPVRDFVVVELEGDGHVCHIVARHRSVELRSDEVHEHHRRHHRRDHRR